MKDDLARFRHPSALTLVLLLLASGPEAGIRPPSASSSSELQERMLRWRAVYVEEMEPVRQQLGSLVEAIHQGRISDIPTICPDFRSAVSAVDRSVLEKAADPVVRGNVVVAVNLLEEAAIKCRRDRFFALSFQLYKVGYLLAVIDRRLARFRAAGVE